MFNRLTRTRDAARAWLIALVFSFVLTGCVQRPLTTESTPWRSVVLGLCEDYPEETRSLGQARADLKAAHESGAKVLRIAFGWDAIEAERGHYDWSFWDDFVRIAVEEYGLRLIPYACYTPKWAAMDDGENSWRSPPRDPADFARFMTVLVNRYKHAIRSWELWNEPDNPAYWLGTREQFAELVRAGSRAVRTADPQATIVLGGIAGETDFLDGLFRVDRIAPSVDVVNLHSYFETWHPDPIESLPGYVERARDIVQSFGENEPLWMAETGYSSVSGRTIVSGVYRAHFKGEHTDRAQADALARTILMGLATEQLPLIAWYRINDLRATEDVIGDDNNRHLGVRSVDGKTKPAFAALAQLTAWFQQPYRMVKADVAAASGGNEPEPEIHVFALRDGRQIVAAWLGTPDNPPAAAVTMNVEPPEDRRRVATHVRVPLARVSEIRTTNALGEPVSQERALWQLRDKAVHLDLTLHGGELLLCELLP
jgi:hypothetical protein